MENEIEEYVSKLKELAVNAKILSEILSTSKYKELPSWIQDKIATSNKEIGDIKGFVNQKLMSKSNDLLEMNNNQEPSMVDKYLKASPQGKNQFKNSLTQLDKISTQLSTIKEGEDSSISSSKTLQKCYFDNENVIKEAIKVDYNAFKYASDRIKDDKEFVLYLMCKKIGVFFQVSERLKDDEEVVKLAVSVLPTFLSFVSPRLKKDSNILKFINNSQERIDYFNKYKTKYNSEINENKQNTNMTNKQNTNMTNKQKSLKEKYDTMYSKVKGDKIKVSKLNEGFKKLGLNEIFFNMNTGKVHGSGFEDIPNSKLTNEQLTFITKVKELVDKMERTVGKDKIFEVLDYYLEKNLVIDLSDFQVKSNKIPVYENKKIKSLVDRIIKEEVSKVLKGKTTLNENFDINSSLSKVNSNLLDRIKRKYEENGSLTPEEKSVYYIRFQYFLPDLTFDEFELMLNQLVGKNSQASTQHTQQANPNAYTKPGSSNKFYNGANYNLKEINRIIKEEVSKVLKDKTIIK